MNNLVLFASGSGSNFITIYNNTLNKKIKNSKIVLLVSNNPNSNSINFAKEAGIDTLIINKRRYPINDEYKIILKEKLLSVKPDLIILAGYMKLIPKPITSLFENKIINIHPGKLPEFGGKGFYGLNVHRAVLEKKEKYTAVTIHYVNENYDEGMIIHEEKIKVLDNDSPESLSTRVLTYEHKIYSDVINKLLNERFN